MKDEQQMALAWIAKEKHLSPGRRRSKLSCKLVGRQGEIEENCNKLTSVLPKKHPQTDMEKELFIIEWRVV